MTSLVLHPDISTRESRVSHGALIAEVEIQKILNSYSQRVTDLIRSGEHIETIQMRMLRMSGDFFDKNYDELHQLFPTYSPEDMVIYIIPDLIRKFWKDRILGTVLDDLHFQDIEDIDNHMYVRLGLWQISEDQLDPVFQEPIDHRNWLDKIRGKAVMEDAYFLYYRISEGENILTPYAQSLLDQYARLHHIPNAKTRK